MSSHVRNIPAFVPRAGNDRLYLGSGYSVSMDCPLGQKNRKFDIFAAVSGIVSGRMAAPAIAMARRTLLKDFFQTQAARQRSNGAVYDSNYHPRSIESALVSCRSVHRQF